MSHEINKDQDKKFSLIERLKSFRYAFHGIIALIRYEHNFRIHVIILFIVVLAGILFRISVKDWLAIIIVSGLVLVSESFNTSIEHLSDMVSGKEDERIRRVKDIAAGAVLLASLAAIITGLIIFIPVLLEYFS